MIVYTWAAWLGENVLSQLGMSEVLVLEEEEGGRAREREQEEEERGGGERGNERENERRGEAVRGSGAREPSSRCGDGEEAKRKDVWNERGRGARGVSEGLSVHQRAEFLRQWDRDMGEREFMEAMHCCAICFNEKPGTVQL